VKYRLPLIAALVAISVWLAMPATAGAAVPSWTYPCASDPNPGACERLTFLAETADADSDRLDLAWWGTWALVGLVLVLLFAPSWFRAWGLEGKLGRG